MIYFWPTTAVWKADSAFPVGRRGVKVSAENVDSPLFFSVFVVVSLMLSFLCLVVFFCGHVFPFDC